MNVVEELFELGGVRTERLLGDELLSRQGEEVARRRPLLEQDGEEGVILVVPFDFEVSPHGINREREAVDDVVRVVVRVLLHCDRPVRVEEDAGPVSVTPGLQTTPAAHTLPGLPTLDGRVELGEERGGGFVAGELVEEGDAWWEEQRAVHPAKGLDDGGEGEEGRRGVGSDGVEREPEGIGRCCGRETGQLKDMREHHRECSPMLECWQLRRKWSCGRRKRSDLGEQERDSAQSSSWLKASLIGRRGTRESLEKMQILPRLASKEAAFVNRLSVARSGGKVLRARLDLAPRSSPKSPSG